MAKPLPSSGFKEPLPREMYELNKSLEALPANHRARLGPLCDRVGQLLQLQSRLIRIAQDTVDQLQLDVKYLLFDLEATRNERDAYQQELENLDGGSNASG
jgi:hypothetical protein